MGEGEIAAGDREAILAAEGNIAKLVEVMIERMETVRSEVAKLSKKVDTFEAKLNTQDQNMANIRLMIAPILQGVVGGGTT